MLRRALLVNSLAMFLFAGVVSAAAPANKVVLAYSSLNERGAGALLVARDQGFFRKYDLDVSLIFMRSAAVALSALSAGEAQFYSGSANGSALGAMAGGLDLVFIAGLANQLNGTMVAAPSIQSPADLKRKNIAIQSIGGGVWMITQLVLEHWGLDPKRDGINLRIVGDESVMVQSLILGTVDATYAGYAYATMLKKQGYHVLADLTKLGVPFQSTAILAREAWSDSKNRTPGTRTTPAPCLSRAAGDMFSHVARTHRNPGTSSDLAPEEAMPPRDPDSLGCLRFARGGSGLPTRIAQARHANLPEHRAQQLLRCSKPQAQAAFPRCAPR